VLNKALLNKRRIKEEGSLAVGTETQEVGRRDQNVIFRGIGSQGLAA